jgi:polygalacturonase
MKKFLTDRKVCFSNVPIFLLTLVIFFHACKTANSEEKAWKQASMIMGHFTEPEFKDQTYSIIDFGALPDSKELSTTAINKAIETCTQQGGGTVLIPDGTFQTGAIQIKSNVRLHLSDKAILSFSTNPDDYLPVVLTRWEGNDCYNYSSLIYANDAENIAITGKGLLKGNSGADNWWKWKGLKEYGWVENEPSQLLPHARPKLEILNKTNVPVTERVMGEGFYLRPQFINFVNCKNVLLSDFTIENSPFWLIHPLLSENIIVRDLHLNSLGPNNDGCNPESCKNVLIENCYFNTGDDCIAIKSGRNSDGLKTVPSEDIYVRNCFMENGHGGVVMGSEISGGIRNVFVENCQMDSPELERVIRVKTNSNRGGVVENIYVRNCKIGEVKEAILRIDCVYDIKNEGIDTLYPVVRNVFIDSVQCNRSKFALLIEGIEGKNCVYGIHVSNCDFEGVLKENSIKYSSDITLENVLINDKKSNEN